MFLAHLSVATLSDSEHFSGKQLVSRHSNNFWLRANRTYAKDLTHQIQDQALLSVIETRVTIVTAQDSRKVRDLVRQQKQKDILLKQIGNPASSSGSNHPRQRLLKALYGFSRYEKQNLAELRRWRDLYGHVPRRQKKILEGAVQYSTKLDRNEVLIRSNQQLCNDIVGVALGYYQISTEQLEVYARDAAARNEAADRTSVSQALKHFVRDWTSDGAHERVIFECILRTLIKYSSAKVPSHGDRLRVLVPGSGLGRLGHDIDGLGCFEVTINEYSMFMNLAYRYLETTGLKTNISTFHPFIDNWSHQASTTDLQRSVTFPDQRLSASVLLVEGDFTTAFRDQQGAFDFMVTHFFIDTARNLMNYLETIHETLRVGGYWINSGPLLYGTGPWVQLSLDEIVIVAEHLGFEFLEMAGGCGERTFGEGGARGMMRGIPGVYGSSERALNMNGYRVQCWVAKKK